MKGKIFLVQFDPVSADRRAQELRECGWEVVGVEAEDGGRAHRGIRSHRPDMIILSLAHKPSHARELGRSLRATKATQDLPLVFVDGDDNAKRLTRSKVANGVYATSEELEATLAPYAT